mmetsp:Transcript_10081/g.35313  ORF Transcript_10081/g.35313 Transcript_10081/m.35313 type:complete len:390 (+) Transcript_10081:850-2019(+)
MRASSMHACTASSTRRLAKAWPTTGCGYVSPSTTPAASSASSGAIHGACIHAASMLASSGTHRCTNAPSGSPSWETTPPGSPIAAGIGDAGSSSRLAAHCHPMVSSAGSRSTNSQPLHRRPSRHGRHRYLHQNVATSRRSLWCSHPVCRRHRTAASTNGYPVLPTRHARAPATASSSNRPAHSESSTHGSPVVGRSSRTGSVKYSGCADSSCTQCSRSVKWRSMRTAACCSPPRRMRAATDSAHHSSRTLTTPIASSGLTPDDDGTSKRRRAASSPATPSAASTHARQLVVRHGCGPSSPFVALLPLPPQRLPRLLAPAASDRGHRCGCGIVPAAGAGSRSDSDGASSDRANSAKVGARVAGDAPPATADASAPSCDGRRRGLRVVPSW